MSRTYRSRRHSEPQKRPLVAFLLVACFGILFAGCGKQEEAPKQQPDEFAFTEEDIARFRKMVIEKEGEVEGVMGTGSDVVDPSGTGGTPLPSDGVPVLDLSKVTVYDSIRSPLAATGEDVYKVVNEFLNVRAGPKVTANALARLDKGDALQLVDFVDAAWAKVIIPGGQEGYVAQRYIAKVVSEEKLAEAKEAFNGMYFVDFGFLNVRKDPDTRAEKMGELTGQQIVRPLDVGETWARILLEGEEGYVASQYLTPFAPNFLVRQERYNLPILHYRATDQGVTDALVQHLDRLQQEGLNLMTLSDVRDFLLLQEEKDVRLEPRSVVLTISNITPENIQGVSDALLASGVQATLFVQTRYVGIDGITQKQMITLRSNGFDVQSGSHSGDDLRSLTNAQLELELAQSRKLLEEATGGDVFAISYPIGGVNERVMTKAAEAGYLFGLSVTPEKSFTRNQILKLPSLLVHAGLGGDDVLSLIGE